MPSRSFRLFSLCLWLSSPLYAAAYVPNGDIIGEAGSYTANNEDNLYAVARRFDLGIVELLAANPYIDPWLPQAGTKLTLTTAHILPPQRKGIVLNLSGLRLYYFAGDQVLTFPIGIGREGTRTLVGSTVIEQKRKDPTWIPPDSMRKTNPNLPAMIPPGPNNPLGEYALNLGWEGYRIHGTNRPAGVGKRSSHGCIRLYPEDIEVLFNAVKIGTPVTVIDMPYQLGWQNDMLFLEVTPTQQESDIIAENYAIPSPAHILEIRSAVQKAAGNATEIDWHAVDEAVNGRHGIPVAIGKKTPPLRHTMMASGSER